jgi:predicted nuclease with RNAse H fold
MAVGAAPVVVGIDLAAGRGVTALVGLALEPVDGRFVVGLAHPVTDDDILAETARLSPSVIALDAPLTLPGSVAAALAGAPWFGHVSPYTRAAERDPIWRSLGVRPLPVSFLGGLTFRAITLAARLRQAIPDAQLIEVFPTATLRALGVRAGSAARSAKTTVEARRSAHAALSAWVVGLPSDEESSPLDADTLDATAAALTAAAFARGMSLAVGDPAEGCIIVVDTARFMVVST